MIFASNGTAFLISVIVIAALVVIGLIIFLIEVIINHKYKKFIYEHSEAIKELIKINKKYQFKDIPILDMKHSYDNENMYDDISCRDYLIYQLVFTQNTFFTAIKDASYNNKLYERYEIEVEEHCELNKYDTVDLPRNRKRLEKVEKKLFIKTKKYPTTEFRVTVKLVLTNINGSYQRSKHDSFNSVEVLDMIMGVNKKRGSFYLDNDIWQSICRVERGKVTNKMRFAVYNRDNWRCRYCGRKTNDLEVDHIIPIAKGGKSTFNNLQTLCHRCNVRKGSDIY